MPNRLARLRYEVTYAPGAYEQGDLPLRKQIRDDEVLEFIKDWLRGITAKFMGKTYHSPGYWTRLGGARSGPMTFVPEGKPIGYRMVYEHAKRLALDGHIEMRFVRERPNWKALTLEANGYQSKAREAMADNHGNGGYEFWPIGLRREGRPKKRARPGIDYTPAHELLRLRRAVPEPLIMEVFDPDALPPNAMPLKERMERQALDEIETRQGIIEQEQWKAQQEQRHREDAARRAAEEQLTAMRRKADEELALMRAPASHSTTSDHEERIRPHGEEPADDQHATIFQNEGETDDATIDRRTAQGEPPAQDAGAQQAGRHRSEGTDAGPRPAHQEHSDVLQDHSDRQSHDARRPRGRARGPAPQGDGQPTRQRRKGRNPGKETEGDAATPGAGDRGPADRHGAS